MTTLKDRAIPLQAQLDMIAATPVRRVAEIDSDHSPFFSAAEELSEHLEELIEELNEDDD